jgi:rod shape-determining protein MreD
MIRISYLRLCFLFILALILSIISFPMCMALIRPLFILLLVIYVQVTLPTAFQVSGLLFLGLTLDVLCASILGEHVLALTLTAWCLSGRAQRFKFFSISQQMAWVFLLSMVYQFILFGLSMMLRYPMSLEAMILPVCMTTLSWPWIKWSVDRVLLKSSRAS